MKSTHAAAASTIRAALKAHSIAASVRARTASMMTAVDVTVTDQAPWTVKAIERFVGQFQCGSFDGMTDSYSYNNRRSDLPQVKYAHVHTEYSAAVRQAAWDYLRAGFAGFEGAPASVDAAHAFRNQHWQEYGSTLLHRVLCGSLGAYWQKPRVRRLG